MKLKSLHAITAAALIMLASPSVAADMPTEPLGGKPPAGTSASFKNFDTFKEQVLYPAVTSIDKAVVQNADGSWDVYFGPKLPEGAENWIQTIPGKGWNMLWRIYGPEQAWYDGEWQPGEVEEVSE